MRKKQLLDYGWTLRECGEASAIEAHVPGSVYTELVSSGRMEDPYWKDNETKALSRMEEDYEYCCRFEVSEEFRTQEHILLHFDGIDTLADIELNGRNIGNARSMHRIWEYDVKPYLREENCLIVRLHSPLRYIRRMHELIPTRGDEHAMEGFMHIRKAHYMFGWDWGAHLPDAGIFRPVSLIGYAHTRLLSVELRQEHREEGVYLWIHPETEGDAGGGYRVRVTDPDGRVSTFEDSPERIQIVCPQLWWPNGLGEQPLYTIEVEYYGADGAVEDRWERKIGLRTLRLHREKDAWGESFAHEINGKCVFAMGADYIPEDHLLGRTSPKRTRRLLEDCKRAHFNTIRVWGGGYYPEDWFYDLCDELGLMVWQDFMFACSMYELTPEFEENIRGEFEDNIRRLRHHPSLALWCGNNEMEQFVSEKHSWVSKPSEVRDYFLMYERIIPETLRRLDPQTPYWPASPSSGGSLDDPNDPSRGDVHYWQVWHGNKPFSEYRKYHFRYVSEFGFQSFPDMATVRSFTDDPRDWNIFSYIMEKHQRNDGANGKIMNYLQQTYLYPTSFEKLIYASQLLQADAIRYGVEHFRRNRGRCMGAIYWQLNDCWPVASWSSIDYSGRWKALHYCAARFFAPVLLSCEEESWMTQGANMNRQPFHVNKSIRLNVSNETLQERKLLVTWQVRNADAHIAREESCTVQVPPLSAVWLEKIELPELDEFRQYVSYQALEAGECVSEGTVLFTYPKYFHFQEPELSYRVEGDELVIRASAYARSVEIRGEQADLLLSDNIFDLNGGEKRVKILRGSAEGISIRSAADIH